MDAFGGVILAFVFFAFGAMLGIGVYGIFQSNKNTKTKIIYRYRDQPDPEDRLEQNQEPQGEVEEKAEAKKFIKPDSSPPPVTKKTPADDWTSHTTQLWYDIETRRIVADMDGEIIELDDEMTPEQKARFSFMVVDLKRWIGESVIPGMEDEEPIANESSKLLDSNAKQDDQETFDLGAKITATFKKIWNWINEEDEEENEKQDGETKQIKSVFDPRSIMQGIVSAELDKIKTPPPPSIAAQINEILKEDLKGSDWPLGHIEVFDGEDHTVKFRVGVNVFDAIDEVKEKKIQKVIQKAIDTWQKENLG